MDSVDGPRSKPPEQDIAPKPPEKKPGEPVSGTHKFRKVKKMAGDATQDLKSRARKKKPHSRAFEQLRAKIKPATSATQLKASQLNAKAVSKSRVFSSKELFAAAGASYGQGKSLRALGKMLDKYNAEVVSSNSQLTPAEKVIRTLTLHAEAQKFLAKKEHELDQVFKLHAQSKQRIMATHQLLGQIQLLVPQQVGSDRTSFSQECCKLLCNDLRNHRAELICELYQQPSILEGLLAEMEYSDVLRFADAHAEAQIEVVGPDQITALSRGVWKSLHTMSSENIKHHVDSFNAKRGKHATQLNVTGNPIYDRSREFCTTMNILLTANNTVTELGVALHQSHVDGHLTMNMLDELTEEKANMQGRNFAEQNQANEATAKLDRKKMRKMHVAKHLPSLKPNSDNPVDVLWLGKINQFDLMLKGDVSGNDRSFQNFVHCWDEIRFQAMPAYSARHEKDGLVETNGIMSKELGKITPQFLEELDHAKGNAEEVRMLLEKVGLHKVPDELNFVMAMEMADKSDNPLRKQRLKHHAAQDCLYRYFEQRAGVDIPLIPPKPASLLSRKPPH